MHRTGRRRVGTHSSDSLLIVRAGMGVGTALIFPATLSIISNLYTARTERAKACGVWSAMTGLGVAFGPVAGGFLLELVVVAR